ncbi:hypothetical protein GCM10022225_68640 [Plantactinospora mayteni]|uniref:Secreted protein n=1 Tax=Plantactinospora mayteni TaxID=566021 RepID=A0ABQ4F0V9_9ACTN|nr:hypothetical protein [Plantactinospora mayteni]GIH00553.1 hypothetical protein Pma05_71250 [Plantactinospora mayteni]
MRRILTLLAAAVTLMAPIAVGGQASAASITTAPKQTQTQAPVDAWVHWGDYAWWGQCLEQGSYLVDHHPDKWVGFECSTNQNKPLTPYELWVLQR